AGAHRGRARRPDRRGGPARHDRHLRPRRVHRTRRPPGRRRLDPPRVAGRGAGRRPRPGRAAPRVHAAVRGDQRGVRRVHGRARRRGRAGPAPAAVRRAAGPEDRRDARPGQPDPPPRRGRRPGDLPPVVGRGVVRRADVGGRQRGV
ncbi:MAG: hypothetical protein AVDCRST_MAG54-2157, partial [uncultured Actinomycetospora sp.]